MAKALIYNEADAAFRHAIYQLIVTRGHVPKIRELAAALSRSEKTIRSALQRLARLHILVLQQNTSQILRAAPFWAVPTAFHVQSGKHAWWASCIWDALAIPAMLASSPLAPVAIPPWSSPSAKDVSSERPALFISPFPPRAGMTTSSSPERPCFSSGRRSTSRAGAEPGRFPTVLPSRFSKACVSQKPGTATGCRPSGAPFHRNKPRQY